MTDLIKSENNLQSAIIEVVKDKNIDPDRLEKFLDLQIRLETRQAEIVFNGAMASFQAKCPAVIKNKKVEYKSTNFEYAQLDEIVTTIKPHLANNGLSFSFDLESINEKTHKLITTVSHKMGHSKSSNYFFDPMAEGGAMNSSQRRKSALTYAKRAGLENALGLNTANEDDDARRCEDEITSEQIDKIKELVKITDTNEAAFCKFIGIKTFEDLKFLSEKEAGKAILKLRDKKRGLK